MRRVALESPYAAPTAALVERNLRYLRAAMLDCFTRGEAPFASHGLYTQPHVLDDSKVEERLLGIEAGQEWAKMAEVRVVYTDLGFSRGMVEGIIRAKDAGQELLFRDLGADWDKYAPPPEPEPATLVVDVSTVFNWLIATGLSSENARREIGEIRERLRRHRAP
jgi:hypothetical protein